MTWRLAGAIGDSNALFPLTPTLSLGEREETIGSGTASVQHNYNPPAHGCFW